MANLTVAILPACAGSLPEPPFSPPPRNSFEEVEFAPPPARVELVPVRPKDSRAVWVDGEWDWTGARWAWQYGRWVVPPAGATYSRWAVVRRSDGVLVFASGAFRDRKGSPLSPPQPLAVARARDEDVIDTEGTTEETGPNIRPENAPRSPGP